MEPDWRVSGAAIHFAGRQVGNQGKAKDVFRVEWTGQGATPRKTKHEAADCMSRAPAATAGRKPCLEFCQQADIHVPSADDQAAAMRSIGNRAPFTPTVTAASEWPIPAEAMQS